MRDRLWLSFGSGWPGSVGSACGFLLVGCGGWVGWGSLVGGSAGGALPFGRLGVRLDWWLGGFFGGLLCLSLCLSLYECLVAGWSRLSGRGCLILWAFLARGVLFLPLVVGFVTPVFLPVSMGVGSTADWVFLFVSGFRVVRAGVLIFCAGEGVGRNLPSATLGVALRSTGRRRTHPDGGIVGPKSHCRLSTGHRPLSAVGRRTPVFVCVWGAVGWYSRDVTEFAALRQGMARQSSRR